MDARTVLSAATHAEARMQVEENTVAGKMKSLTNNGCQTDYMRGLHQEDIYDKVSENK
jgi:hypothetical protein